MGGTDFTLYGTPASVYSCKVRLALALKGLHWTELTPPGGYGSADYKMIVAQGTVPALVHGYFILAESDAIIEYLDDIGAGPPLLPPDAQTRGRARAMSRFIDTRLEPAARALFPLVGTGASVPDAARAALVDHLDTLGRMSGPGPFLTGSGPSLPDCGFWPVAAVLAMLDDALELDLPSVSLALAGDTPPVVAPYLADYRAMLAGWAQSKGLPG